MVALRGGGAVSYEPCTPALKGGPQDGPEKGRAREGGVIQGYLALKKTRPSLGPPHCPRHGPTVAA